MRKRRGTIDYERVLKLRAEGLSYKIIALRLGCGERSVAQYVRAKQKASQ